MHISYTLPRFPWINIGVFEKKTPNISVRVIANRIPSHCSVHSQEDEEECPLFRLEADCLKSCQSQALGLCRESNGSIMLWSVCGLGHVHHSDIFTAASDE